MKKALLFPLFASLLLPACHNAIHNQAEVDTLKALLSKQDLSPSCRKIFAADFAQDYEFFSSFHENDEQATQFHSYHGGGAFGCVYDVSEEAYQKVLENEDRDFFDFFARGKGGYGLIQSARVASYHYQSEGDERAMEGPVSLNFFQKIQANFNDQDVQVASALIYSEGLDGHNTRSQNFNGQLSKAALFDSISVRSLSDLFARTNLYDGQHSCELIDGIYEDTLRRLSQSKDEELSAFLRDNHVTFEEKDANTLVHFELGEQALLDALSAKEIIPGTMKGTLTYEKSTGAFTHFEYHIVHAQSESDPSAGKVSSASMKFTALGYVKNEAFPDDIYITPNPVVYEEGSAFLSDMIEGIIPQLV